jgi:hypothetical protein
MAGYSGTPLPRKLGIKPDHAVGLVNGPPGFVEYLGPLPAGASVVDGQPAGLDVALLFVTSAADLTRNFPRLAKRLTSAGGLWVAWPKKASGVATDLTEDVVRRIGLATGLVDNKVCAIDDVWSGLRFVFRIQDRPKAPKPRRGSARE